MILQRSHPLYHRRKVDLNPLRTPPVIVIVKSMIDKEKSANTRKSLKLAKTKTKVKLLRTTPILLRKSVGSMPEAPANMEYLVRVMASATLPTHLCVNHISNMGAEVQMDAKETVSYGILNFVSKQ